MTKRMTKTDFERIAEVLRELKPDVIAGYEFNTGERAQWALTVTCFVAMLRDASNLTPNGNRAFDEDKFRKAVNRRPTGRTSESPGTSSSSGSPSASTLKTASGS